MKRCTLLAAAVAALATIVPAAATAAGPAPGSPEYVARDLQNINDAYGRISGPGGQVQNPNFLPALLVEHTDNGLRQLAEQFATPTRPAITPGEFFPGWNGGNPLRRGWNGKRGQLQRVSWTNRYGALIRGDVFAPLPGAKDPYTRRPLKPPYPGVVITTGSIQGSERMYWWLAQDLAERGYVVLTYDVQGQGTSETLPHPTNAVPFCNPFATPEQDEMTGCPGVPFQQEANFTKGTIDALDFFVSRPDKPYKSPASADVDVNTFNPYWKLFDRSRDRKTATPGRTTRIAIIGHSLGAAAVSKVQGTDARVQTVVALDKLAGPNDSPGPLNGAGVKPTVPALGIQSEYGFSVNPYFMSGGSSVTPSPTPPNEAPDPKREEKTGFDPWRKAGVDTMVVVPRASTHLEYTDIAYALPASRYGQALSSVYVQAWLDRYLRHQGTAKRLLKPAYTYLEPGPEAGRFHPIQLNRADFLSFYYCSGYDLRDRGQRFTSVDVTGVGCTG